MLSIFQPIGVLVCSGIAYGFIPRFSCALSPNAPEVSVMNAADCPRSENMGWRYMLFTLGGITLFVFFARFLVFTFRESPQYLLARGLDEKAIDVVKQIARVNKAKPPLFGLHHFDEIDRRLGLQPGLKRKVAAKESARESCMAMIRNFANARFLFSTPTMARVTIILWLVFIADFWSFSMAGFFLPQILIDKGGAANIPLSETYKNFVAIYAPGIAGCLLAACMVEVPRLGRQWAMVFSSALMAISLFLYTVVDTQAASVGFNAMEYFFQSMFNAILYAFVPEVYPSSVRGTASGLASTWGRLSSILAPIAGQSLYSHNTNGVLYLAGGVMLLCPVALALLPFDTRGRRTF
jgi:Major Facilitator Superfamily